MKEIILRYCEFLKFCDKDYIRKVNDNKNDKIIYETQDQDFKNLFVE